MIDQLLITLERLAWRPSRKRWVPALAMPFRVTLTVIRGLYEDQLWLHAGYMSYFSLLHLVPLGALALAVSTRLGWKQALMNWVENSLSPAAPELAEKLVQAMDRLDLAALGYVGLAAIIIAGVFSISRLEKDLGAIWNTPVLRTPWQRLLLYPGTILLLPAVVALVLVFGTMAEARTTLWIRAVADWGEAGRWLYRALINLPLLFRITPYALVWSMLTFIYWLGTPGPVRLRSAMLGGLVGAVLWQAAQGTYLHFQFATSTYREVWGYLAQLPLLLIWIYASWMTLYIGAEFTFAWQHRRAHMPKLPLLYALRTRDEPDAAIGIASDVLKSQSTGRRTMAPNISERCRLPLQLVQHVAKRLTDAGVLSESRVNRQVRYHIVGGMEKLTVGDLLDRYHHASPKEEPAASGPRADLKREILLSEVGQNVPRAAD